MYLPSSPTPPSTLISLHLMLPMRTVSRVLLQRPLTLIKRRPLIGLPLIFSSQSLAQRPLGFVRPASVLARARRSSHDVVAHLCVAFASHRVRLSLACAATPPTTPRAGPSRLSFCLPRSRFLQSAHRYLSGLWYQVAGAVPTSLLTCNAKRPDLTRAHLQGGFAIAYTVAAYRHRQLLQPSTNTVPLYPTRGVHRFWTLHAPSAVASPILPLSTNAPLARSRSQGSGCPRLHVAIRMIDFDRICQAAPRGSTESRVVTCKQTTLMCLSFVYAA